MSDEELIIKIKEWLTDEPSKVSEAIAYLLMSNYDKSEMLNVEREFHKWLNN